MPLFSYKAVDSAGKSVQSSMEAFSESEVIEHLQKNNMIPVRVALSSRKFSRAGSLLSIDVKTFFQRISSKDIMLFTQDLTALLEAGLPVDRSLKILFEATENPKFKGVIKEILRAIEGGVDLSEAMGRHPKVFSEFYVNMVRAGEAGGVLNIVLQRLGVFLGSSQELKDFIKSAMVYPLFLLAVGGISIIVLMTYVIPNFSVIFSDMESAVPWSTQLLLGMSRGFRSWWWAILLAVVIVYFLLARYIKSPAGRLRFDALKMRTPLVGDLVKKIEVGRITRTLGTLIESGVPILNAIVLVKQIVSNKTIARSMDSIHDKVKEGERLSVPLANIDIFPPLAIHMIKVGEETGNMSGMLLRVADNYDNTVKNLIKRLVSLLEPMMILLMGVVIGFVVVSMLMAIFSMNDVVF